MNPTKNLIDPKPYMNHSKNLIEPKLHMNPTKNLIDPKLYMQHEPHPSSSFPLKIIAMKSKPKFF